MYKEEVKTKQSPEINYASRLDGMGGDVHTGLLGE